MTNDELDSPGVLSLANENASMMQKDRLVPKPLTFYLSFTFTLFSLVPRQGGEGERVPGTHCLRMCHHGILWQPCSYVYDVINSLRSVHVQLVFCSSEFYIALFYAFW